MNISKQVVIVSAERHNLTDVVNEQRTESFKGLLTDANIGFNSAIGVYSQKRENSLVVVVNNQAEYQAVTDFAFLNFDQESILHQDSNQEARLVFANGATEGLGRLESVTPEVAVKRDSYTILNGGYYTTNKR